MIGKMIGKKIGKMIGKFALIITVISMLSSITGTSGTPTTPFVTEQFCKDTFTGHELKYCECHLIKDTNQNPVKWEVKEHCMKNVVSDYHVELFKDSLKAQKDIQDGKIKNEEWILKRRQNFQSYTTMCELIYSKAAGRAATCACDAYDFLFEGAEKRANCVHAAFQLLANDVMKEERIAKEKPICNFVASVTHTTFSMIHSFSITTPVLLQILNQVPKFASTVHATWEFISNPWTWVYTGGTTDVAGGVYLHQCVLS